MPSYTEETFAQIIAQLEDSGQNAGVCIMAEMKKDRTPSDKNKYYWMWREEKKKVEELQKENKELKEDNKKISRQIEDRINQMRKSGM